MQIEKFMKLFNSITYFDHDFKLDVNTLIPLPLECKHDYMMFEIIGESKTFIISTLNYRLLEYLNLPAPKNIYFKWAILDSE